MFFPWDQDQTSDNSLAEATTNSGEPDHPQTMSARAASWNAFQVGRIKKLYRDKLQVFNQNDLATRDHSRPGRSARSGFARRQSAKNLRNDSPNSKAVAGEMVNIPWGNQSSWIVTFLNDASALLAAVIWSPMRPNWGMAGSSSL